MIPPAVIIWLVLAGPAWAALGAWWLPRDYRNKGLDDAPARFIGGLAGLTLGPFLLLPLWRFTPDLSRWYWGGGVGILLALELYGLFAALDPENLCVTNGGYVANQVTNGLTIGFIYALMAVGLTLIYSVQGIISFAHGQFYMVGGYISYYLLQIFTNLNPIIGVPVAGLSIESMGWHAPFVGLATAALVCAVLTLLLPETPSAARARGETLARARQDVAKAEARLKTARAGLRACRDREGVIDPRGKAAAAREAEPRLLASVTMRPWWIWSTKRRRSRFLSSNVTSASMPCAIHAEFQPTLPAPSTTRRTAVTTNRKVMTAAPSSDRQRP